MNRELIRLFRPEQRIWRKLRDEMEMRFGGGPVVGRRPLLPLVGEGVGRSASSGLAGDMTDIGAVDAEVMQLAVRVGGQLTHDAPVDLAGAKKTTYESEVHRCLHFHGADSSGPPKAGPARDVRAFPS